MGRLSQNISQGRCQRYMVRQCLIALALTLGAGSAAAQNIELELCVASPESPRPLGADAKLTRTMKANELHVFELTVAANQYVHVVVEQKGIDVVVGVRDPSGSILFSRDSPNGKFGPEQVSVKAQSAGTYRVEVCSGRTEPSGSYDISLDGPRAVTPADEKRLEAEAFLRAGGQELRKYSDEGRKAALGLYEQGLNKWAELGDNQEQGYTFCAIGEAHRHLRNFAGSMSNYNQALLRLGAANDKSGQAYVRNAMAAAHRDLTSEPAKAMDYYDAALALRRAVGDRWGEVHLRNNIGHLYTRMGRNLAAIDNLKALLSLWRELGARDQELNTLNNIATANVELGNVSAAHQDIQYLLSACEQEKALCSCVPEKQMCLEGSIHNGLGMIYEVWGQSSHAFEEYEKAIESFTKQQEQGGFGIATVINNLGMLLAGLNEPQAALDQFRAALSLPKSPNEALTRSNMGYAYTLLSNLTEAQPQLQQALTLTGTKNDRLKSYTLMRLGDVYALSSKKLEALTYYNQALDLFRTIGDARGEAITLNKIAQLNILMGQVVKARQLYLDAQRRSQEVTDVQGEAEALYGLAQLARRQRNLPQAREYIVAAIQKVESLRTSTTNYRFRRNYFESRYDYYALETDIRMQLYFEMRAGNDLSGAQKELEAALYAAERARVRNLLDVLRESRADIRQGVDPELLKKERSQQNELTEKLERLQKMLAEKGKETQKADLQRDVRLLERSLEETQGEIRKRSPRYAALTQAQPLKPAQIQGLLDDETCILQYALGDERSYLWLITAKEILPYALPRQAAIKQATEAVKNAIRIYEPRESSADKIKQVWELQQAMPVFRRRARELSNLILAPVASKIVSKRLVIVADGDLQYIPFSVLPVPDGPGSTTVNRQKDFTYLIAKHEIIYEPSASALGLLRQDPRGKVARTVAVLADPVFSQADERVKDRAAKNTADRSSSLEDVQLRRMRGSGDTASDLVRLRYSRVEAEAIKAVAPAGSTMEALDFDANRETVLSDELKQFRIIHLATHGRLDALHPELSALVFSLVDKEGKSRPGFLRLNDIYNMNLRADLVVLSACETGIGKQLKSEGLLGLTRGFMYAGAERVAATLWKVDDIATSELMKRFYTYMLREGKPASDALRHAQLDMAASAEWSAPFYWAGFVLQGEWK